MNNITNVKIRNYINSLYKQEDPGLARLRSNAEERGIPIITRDTEMLLGTLLAIRKPRHILEIGTAIGYSSIFFARSCLDSTITTIEVDERMRKEAAANIGEAGLENRIRLLAGDAAEILPKVGGPFELVFIDAAKGHYKEYFDHCLDLCNDGAVIISDNILFKGITASDEFLDKRRDRTIMMRMREYLEYISNLGGTNTSVLPVGDGVAVTTIMRRD